MADHDAGLAGLPFWELRFEADGGRVHYDDSSALTRAVRRGEIADLLIFSHVRNNDRATAASFHGRFLAQLAGVASDAGVSGGLGVAVVSWPSMQWPGDQPENDRDADAEETLRALHALFPDPVQQAALDSALALLGERPESALALQRFQGLLALLAEGPALPLEDTGKAALVDGPAGEAFEAVAGIDSHPHASGFPRMWAGAEQALRLTSYFQMTKRTGVVAVAGLAPLLTRLLDEPAKPRVHLIGHSTGARLVAYALRGLDAGRRVHSLTLLQGTFSHFAFAESLPFAPDRGGGLADRRERVDGPILVTHSRHDLAVGQNYVRASMIERGGDAPPDAGRRRWVAMGYDGAQCCQAAELRVGPVGHHYSFTPGGVFNLEAGDVIKTQRGRGGAHNDIHHPELAWAVLSAARIV